MHLSQVKNKFKILRQMFSRFYLYLYSYFLFYIYKILNTP